VVREDGGEAGSGVAMAVGYVSGREAAVRPRMERIAPANSSPWDFVIKGSVRMAWCSLYTKVDVVGPGGATWK
jgi:hypothetical protein